MKIKIYVINLKRCQNKLKLVIEQLKKTQFQYQIVDAIDGNNINNDYLEENEIEVNVNFFNPYFKNTHTWGEIGCTLSHVKAWEIASKDNVDYAIILEDDAVMDNNFDNIVNQLINIQDMTYDMVYLGRKNMNNNTVEKHVMSIGSNNLVQPNFSYWTIGYILSKSGYKKLLTANYKKSIIPIDEFFPQVYLNMSSTEYGINDYTIENLITYALTNNIIKPYNYSFNDSTTEHSGYYNHIYIDDFHPYKNCIQSVSVGTDMVDGLKRFINSCQIFGFPYKILGLNDNWEGNDLRYSTGGGQKINLLREYLNNLSDEHNNKLILFTDSYDVVLSDNPVNIINKFNAYDCDILFGAEPLLWPDKSLDKHFNSEHPYKYLNSGNFIGTVKNIKLLINKTVKNTSDDQLYYQLEYINNKQLNIKLDHKCKIFQTLSARFSDIEIDNSRVKNNYTHTYPSVIHGNGGIKSKLFLNHLGNYINLRWRSSYGYKDNHSIKNIGSGISIYVIIFITDIKNIHNIDNLFNITYSKGPITYNIINTTTENITKYINILKKNYNVDIIVNDISPKKEIELLKLIFNKNDSDYFYIGNCNHKIINYDLFNILLKSNLEIVGGLVCGINNTALSNYWGELDNNGYYKRSSDYIDIVQKTRTGYWNIPYISGNYIISKNKIEKFLKNTLNSKQMNEDYEMYIARKLRENYHFMYICNSYDFGFILD